MAVGSVTGQAAPAADEERRDRRKLLAIIALVGLLVIAVGAVLGLTEFKSSGSSSPAEQTSALPPIAAPAVVLVAGALTHDRAVAGKPFVVRLRVTQRQRTGPLTVRCPARLGPRALAGTPSIFAGEAMCRWRLQPPARDRG
ncbi:MAG TPA: hypothetical protein VHS03_09150 [Gaiellaceae bacterium]|jgi:hypothetical protein|nr:hypothetical protein [Gaiellaceae bacterium]